ncbi:DNA-binding transcriptional LysR family regulator [Desulfitispora alkaliphila]
MANELHFTQPTVSKQLQALENIYNTKLIERSGKKIRPTEQGKVLYEYAVDIMETLKEAENAVKKTKREIMGDLYLASSTIPGQYILPHIIGIYKEKYPKVNISLEVSSSAQVQKMLLNGETDIGFIGAKPQNKQLEYRSFMEDELIFIISPKNIKTNEILSLNNIRDIPIISRKQGSATRKIVEERLAQAGIESSRLANVMEFGNNESVKTAVEAGMGGAFVSKWSVQKELRLGTLIGIKLKDVSLNRKLFVAYPCRKYIPAVSKSFLEYINSIDVYKIIDQQKGHS